MAIQDKPFLEINGKTLGYNNKFSSTDGSPERKVYGQIGGKPVITFDYSNSFATIKVDVICTAETEEFLNQLKANGDNNTLIYGTKKFNNVIYHSNKTEYVVGEPISIEFTANPL